MTASVAIRPLGTQLHLSPLGFPHHAKVFCSWSPSIDLKITPKEFKAVLRSNTWYEYEKGKLSETEAYQSIALEFSLEAMDVASVVQCARAFLRVDPRLLQQIRDLKSELGVRFFATSNVSAPDFYYLEEKYHNNGSELFEHTYTSAAAQTLGRQFLVNDLYRQARKCSVGYLGWHAWHRFQWPRGDIEALS